MKHKLKVFLSSAQNGNEFTTERAALPTFFEKDPLSSCFILWVIEEQASPNRIQSHYRMNVEDSDALIILLGSELRDAVKDEFTTAIKRKVPVFAFLKSSCTPNPEMKRFITESVYTDCTTSTYTSFQELTRKIEDSLLEYFVLRAPNATAYAPLVQMQPTTDEERTLRLLVGVLDSEQTAATKDKAIDAILLEILAQLKRPAKATDIKSAAFRLISDSTHSLDKHLDAGLGRLKDAGQITCISDGHYRLADVTTKRLNAQTATADAEDNAMYQALYKKQASLVGATNFDTYKKTIQRCISRILYENALQLATIQLSGDCDSTPFDAEELSRMVSAVLSTENTICGGVGAWHTAIIQLIASAETQTVRWLNRQRKAYWILATLGIDPHCSSFKRGYLSQYYIYLDSHIVLRALVGAGGESQICSEIVSLGRELGITMVISDAMVSEVDNAFNVAQKTYCAANKDVARMAEVYARLDRKSDILSGYLRAKEASPSLSFETFLGKFYSPLDSSKLHTFIEHEMGIQVETLQSFTEDELGEVEVICTQLLKKRRQEIERTAPEELDRWEGRYRLRTNEARQISIIYRKRKEFGNSSSRQCWFVTFDEFVYEVSIELMKSASPAYTGPCHMKPTRWLEILANTSGPNLPVNVFREVLLSETIQHAADALETQVIAEMLSARLDQEIRSVEMLRKMFADVLNRPAVQDAYESLMLSDNKGRREAVDKVKDVIIASMGDKLKVLESELQGTLEAKAEADRKAEKGERRARYYRAEATKAKKGPKKKNQ